MLASGRPRAEWPKCLISACCENVPSGPEEADLQRLLLGQAGRHDFAEQAHQHVVRQRAVIAVEHLAQHLRLALRPVVVDGRLERPLGLADLLRPAGAFGDQGLDLPVDAVDALARLGQRGRGRLQRLWLLAAGWPWLIRAACWKSSMKSTSACTPATGIAL